MQPKAVTSPIEKCRVGTKTNKQLKRYQFAQVWKIGIKYEKTNQTFPISADRLGTNLHLDIELGAF